MQTHPDVFLYHADCRDALRALPDNCIDSCVTDPPYHLTSVVKRFGTPGSAPAQFGTDGLYARQSRGFMSKEWDGGDIAFQPALWSEVLRVLKPGGHVVAFGASRGYHRMACAIEDAGFEIRDSLMYLYGTGFPKSHNLDNKRGDLICGCETESPSECDMRSVLDADVSTQVTHGEMQWQILQPSVSQSGVSVDGSQASTGRISASVRSDQSVMEGRSLPPGTQGQLRVDEVHSMPGGPSADGAQGRVRDGAPGRNGSPLPPPPDTNGMRASSGSQSEKQFACEPGTVAGQSQSQDGRAWPHCGRCGKPMVARGLGTSLKPAFEPIVLARKPLSEPTVAANVLRWRTGALNIDGCRVPCDWSTDPTARGWQGRNLNSNDSSVSFVDHNKHLSQPNDGGRWPANVVHDGSDEVVGAFPVTTSGSGNKNVGNRGHNTYSGGALGKGVGNGIGGDSGSAARFFYSSKASKADRAGSKHPTVKPVALMQWLARLVTPPGGVILDPFAGSGTTGAAALAEGFKAVLCEREDEYVADIRRRLAVNAA